MKAFAGQVLIFKRPPVSASFSLSSPPPPPPLFLNLYATRSSCAGCRFIRFGACLVAGVADHVSLAVPAFSLLRRYSLLADQPSAPVPQLIRGWLLLHPLETFLSLSLSLSLLLDRILQHSLFVLFSFENRFSSREMLKMIWKRWRNFIIVGINI